MNKLIALCALALACSQPAQAQTCTMSPKDSLVNARALELKSRAKIMCHAGTPHKVKDGTWSYTFSMIARGSEVVTMTLDSFQTGTAKIVAIHDIVLQEENVKYHWTAASTANKAADREKILAFLAQPQ